MVSENVNYEELFSVIKDYKYGRYLEDVDLPLDTSIKLVTDKTFNFLSGEDSKYFTSYSTENVLRGILLFRISKWDTDHFNKSTVALENIYISNVSLSLKVEIVNFLLDQFLIWCMENSIDFVFTRIPALDLITINCLERKGFNFIESWIFNKYNLKNHSEGINEINLRFAVESDIDYMISYSRNAFKTQRFHADSHIPYERAESVYVKLVQEALQDSDKNILVYENNNIPVAFMIYSLCDLTSYYNLKFAIWKMAIIDPHFRGKGIGTNFFKAILDYHYNDGIDIIESSLSMRNIISLNTHIKIGFKVISSLLTMHLWMK